MKIKRAKKQLNKMLSEWQKQSFIQLIFPHSKSDWNCCLEEASTNFLNIIYSITPYQPCLIICDDIKRVQSYFTTTNNIYFIEQETNDTWSRDSSVITVMENTKFKLLDFTFNGWGDKFEATLDNSLSNRLSRTNFYADSKMYEIDFVLEGGSIESDGEGTLLTTTKCLLNKNRNPNLNKIEIENILKYNLDVKKILWLNSGEIAGDDTDAHIDTIARFASNDTIIYVACDKNIKSELESFKSAQNRKYNLVALPHIEVFDENGEALPATYANFLIINGAILVPVYGVSTDREAIEIIRSVFTDRNVIAIDCQTLIKQHGSLHCVTMQMYHRIIM